MATKLLGNEIVLVQGISPTGAASGVQEQTTTQAIANLGLGSPYGITFLNNVLKGVPCANESAYPDGLWSGVGSAQVYSQNTRKSFITNRAVSYIRLAYVTQQVANPVTQQVAFRASIEYPTGIYTPVTFLAKRTGVADGGQLIISDPVEIGIPTNTQFWVRGYYSSPTNPFMDHSATPLVASQGEGSDANFNTGQLDKTITGTIAVNSTSGFWPFAVIGDLGNNIPFVGLAGDSIMTGFGDTTWQVTGFGFGRRAMNNVIPFVDVGVSGTSYQANFTANQLPAWWQLLGGCTHIINEMGINDVNGAVTITQLETNAINYARLLVAANLNVQIYQTTLTPLTTSTDSWATLANQSVTANEPTRLAFNAWVRGGMPINATTFAPVAVGTVGALTAGQVGHPYKGYFDLEVVVSGLNGSNIVWSVGYVSTTLLGPGTTGIHPSTIGHVAMAAVIQPIAATWVA